MVINSTKTLATEKADSVIILKVYTPRQLRGGLARTESPLSQAQTYSATS
jgi:hypothetical protein